MGAGGLGVGAWGLRAGGSGGWGWGLGAAWGLGGGGWGLGAWVAWGAGGAPGLGPEIDSNLVFGDWNLVLGWVGREIDGLGGSTLATTSNFYLFLS